MKLKVTEKIKTVNSMLSKRRYHLKEFLDQIDSPSFQESAMAFQSYGF